jgi:Fe-S cluster assembly iron-binding protein IscA
MLKGMANVKKSTLLNKGLNMLNGQELDYMKKLANSLLSIQNDGFIQKPKGLKNDQKTRKQAQIRQ